MGQIKVSEKFLSIQGEGLHSGTPSVFLRTFGCNFSCRGFGMPKGILTTEPDEIAKNADQYQKYEDLPLSKTGCDSYPSWHPAFKHLSPLIEVGDLVNDIVNLLPQKKFLNEHLVITGGEPLLGWQREYPELIDQLVTHHDLARLTFETNGTQKLTKTFAEYLDYCTNYSANYLNVTFACSPKLTVSGHTRKEAIKPENIIQYSEYGIVFLKFVVASEEDVDEVEEVVQLYRNEGFQGRVYLMPLGGVEEVFNMNKTKIANLALKRGYFFSDRLHISLFGNAWAT